MTVFPVAYSLVEKLFKDKKDLEKQLKAFSAELVSMLGSSLAASAFGQSGQSGQSLPADSAAAAGASPPILVHHRSGADLAFLLALADAIAG